MTDAVRIGRVIGLLEEAKELTEGDHQGLGIPKGMIRANELITQAQNLLVGGDGPSPRMN